MAPLILQPFATPWTEPARLCLSMGFSRQEYWSGLPCPPPGDLPNPGIEPVFPALAGRFFTADPAGKPREDEGITDVFLYFGELLTSTTGSILCGTH